MTCTRHIDNDLGACVLPIYDVTVTVSSGQQMSIVQAELQCVLSAPTMLTKQGQDWGSRGVGGAAERFDGWRGARQAVSIRDGRGVVKSGRRVTSRVTCKGEGRVNHT